MADAAPSNATTMTADMNRALAPNPTSLGDPDDKIEPPGPAGEVDRARRPGQPQPQLERLQVPAARHVDGHVNRAATRAERVRERPEARRHVRDGDSLPRSQPRPRRRVRNPETLSAPLHQEHPHGFAQPRVRDTGGSL